MLNVKKKYVGRYSMGTRPIHHLVAIDCDSVNSPLILAEHWLMSANISTVTLLAAYQSTTGQLQCTGGNL